VEKRARVAGLLKRVEKRARVAISFRSKTGGARLKVFIITKQKQK